ncbi:hypothetical protein [Brevundimonas sp.]|uniref:hypothetical protein n=1 Tax=Brevundimonas sp. TaxID=1871086 RepID=UPI0025BD1A8C|nr:hypothetical protein [Brevundimonas sp.]
MFGLFFHPRRSDDGRPVAVRVVPGQLRGDTLDAPPPITVTGNLKPEVHDDTEHDVGQP